MVRLYAYQLSAGATAEEEGKDSLTEKEKRKKPGKKNGHHLVLRNLETKKEDTLAFVTDYIFAEKGAYLAYVSTGTDKESETEIRVLDVTTGTNTLLHSSKKGTYRQMGFHASGTQLAFVADTDTTKVQIRPNALYLWKKGAATADRILDNTSAPKPYLISGHRTLDFSENGNKLYFGLAPRPVIKDTSLLKEEIVNVEVWTYDEPELYTVQEIQLKNDSIRSFLTAYDIAADKVVPLADTEYPEASLGQEGNAALALVRTSTPYDLERQWTARRRYDYGVRSTDTGETVWTFENTPRLRLSPEAQYAYGYDRVDSTWVSYNLRNGQAKTLTKDKVFFDEENDSPNFPYAYGMAGWTKNDAFLLVYDRYDIWKIAPDTGAAERLTQGREEKKVYRYIKLDEEEKAIDLNREMMLSVFDEVTKDGGYARYEPKKKKVQPLISGPYRYANLQKALLDDRMIYTYESFEVFPDLHLVDENFKKSIRLSDANPQQSDYNWGSVGLVDWVSLDGKDLKGMLITPEDFDPNKKYPLLVNFYERSSDRLHRHRHPKPERSTINYSLYASKGYIIFNPDVHYRIGYPGESAYNCVIPGITALIEKGFIDKENIGVQGHSWGAIKSPIW